MVAYVALNSMTEGALTTGRVYDFQSHREVATRRTLKYIGLLLVVGILSLIGVITSSVILGIVPSLIFWVFFVLVYQIFTFEDDISLKDCFRRSIYLVRGNWWRTSLLMFILWFFSVYIITEGVSVIFASLHLTDRICSLFDFIGNNMPFLETVNDALKYFGLNVISVNAISKSVFMLFLTTVITGLSLPIRSICFTLWYKTLSGLKDGKNVSKIDKSKKNKRGDEE